jgi:hypothetical protein
MTAAIFIFATLPFCLSIDPWWDVRRMAYGYGLSKNDVDYFIRVNEKSGWRSPEEKR